MRPSRALPSAALLAATLAVGLVACTNGGGARGAAGTTALPVLPAGTVPGAAPDTVPPTLPVPEGFEAPDTRGVYLKPVESKLKDKVDHTKPLLPVQGGHATLRGVVLGPDGPLEGARVRLERFAGGDFGILDVGTGKDGKFEATDLLGGRYRVRAWHEPDLATMEPQSTFLKEDGTAELLVGTQKFEGVTLQGAIDVPDPHVGQKLSFRALLSRPEVDGNGIVQARGIGAADVAVIPLEGLRVIGAATATTDGDGFASFTLMCTAAGEHSVVLRSGDQDQAIGLPACGEGTVPADDAPDTIDLPVGKTFKIPVQGPIPGGTYSAATAGTCGLSYEEWSGADWVRKVTFDRDLTFVNPVRDVKNLPGTTACSYTRTG